jgi:uncharacterized protein YoxC
MKSTMVLIVLALVFAGCGNRTEELEKEKAELQKQYADLRTDLDARDAYIDEVTKAINEVYTNLEDIRSKEQLVRKETGEMETGKRASAQEIRRKLLGDISAIDSTLQQNRKRIADLQSRANTYRKQYTGLQEMVKSLQQTIAEREQALASLEDRVRGLESDLAEKSRIITQRDSLIAAQQTQMNTAYYIVGTRKELEDKGIIRDEGGFLWFGKTTVLAAGFDRQQFTPISRTESRRINVSGAIEEIVPKRKDGSYSTAEVDPSHSELQIVHPEGFWENDYLVIVTD